MRRHSLSITYQKYQIQSNKGREAANHPETNWQDQIRTVILLVFFLTRIFIPDGIIAKGGEFPLEDHDRIPVFCPWATRGHEVQNILVGVEEERSMISDRYYLDGGLTKFKMFL